MFILAESKNVQDAHFKRWCILAGTLLCICKPVSTLMYMPDHLLLLHSALFTPDNSAKRLMSCEYRKQTFLSSTDGDGRIANRIETFSTWVLFFNYFQGWRSCKKYRPFPKWRAMQVWMQSNWKEMEKEPKNEIVHPSQW